MNFVYGIYGKKVEYSIHSKFDLCYRINGQNAYTKHLLANHKNLFINPTIIGNYINFQVPENVKNYCYKFVLEGRFKITPPILEKVFIDGCNPNPYGVPHFGNMVSTILAYLYSRIMKLRYKSVDYALFVSDEGKRNVSPSTADTWIWNFLSHKNHNVLCDLVVRESVVSKLYSKYLHTLPYHDEQGNIYINRSNKNSKFNKKYIYLKEQNMYTYAGKDLALYMYLTARSYDRFILVAGKDHKGYMDDFHAVKHEMINIKLDVVTIPLIYNVRGLYSKRKNITPINMDNFHVIFKNLSAFKLALLSITGDVDQIDTKIIERYKSFLNWNNVNMSFKSLFHFLNVLDELTINPSFEPLKKFLNNPLLKNDVGVMYLMKKFIL